MCILCDDCVDLFKCIFDFCNHDLDGMCVAAPTLATITMSGATFHPFEMGC